MRERGFESFSFAKLRQKNFFPSSRLQQFCDLDDFAFFKKREPERNADADGQYIYNFFDKPFRWNWDRKKYQRSTEKLAFFVKLFHQFSY
jgi:hypothetical protein